jgi:uncharacterized membrane protein
VPIVLLTKSPEFRLIFMTLLFPVMLAFVSKTNALNSADPLIIVLAGTTAFLLSWFISKLSKKMYESVKYPTDHKKDAILMFTLMIVIFAVSMFGISLVYTAAPSANSSLTHQMTNAGGGH